jgi:hypothetical protein
MGFIAKIFGGGYNDRQLVAQAEIAINSDPLIHETDGLVVTSEKGVIKISGVVHKEQEKDRIEGAVRGALNKMGLKYASIINELKVTRAHK